MIIAIPILCLLSTMHISIQANQPQPYQPQPYAQQYYPQQPYSPQVQAQAQQSASSPWVPLQPAPEPYVFQPPPGRDDLPQPYVFQPPPGEAALPQPYIFQPPPGYDDLPQPRASERPDQTAAGAEFVQTASSMPQPGSPSVPGILTADNVDISRIAGEDPIGFLEFWIECIKRAKEAGLPMPQIQGILMGPPAGRAWPARSQWEKNQEHQQSRPTLNLHADISPTELLRLISGRPVDLVTAEATMDVRLTIKGTTKEPKITEL
ncbi:uncharacterized protein LY89DRAFT_23065 [Mollisia scopiformis]|uniref:Uncharacterized protein n=1 Tax=Mollisia scopiformis TaxID=149040 RepID=A0A194XWF0_MOLSC|nr:uncharacterized protein LY89DRAFT_23065 [Mollisia scopiformis]KUJ24461.1 hypothetical protein LY89DRAFT_23065 [Mollisia scopiformis]